MKEFAMMFMRVMWFFVLMSTGAHAGMTLLDSSYAMSLKFLSKNDVLYIRGKNATVITFNLQGSRVFLPSTLDPVILIAPGKTLILQNVTLVGFKPEHLTLQGPTSRLLFGEGVVLEMESDLDVTKTLTFSGNVVVNGNGKVLTIKDQKSLLVLDSSIFQIKDCVVKGLKNFVSATTGGYAASIQCGKTNSRLVLSGARCFLDSSWSLTTGYLSIVGDVSFTSTWATFAYSSGVPMTIQSNSTLSFLRGITFHYASIAGPNKLQFADATSVLAFHNSVFSCGSLGLNLSAGNLFFRGEATCKSLSADPLKALTFDVSLFTALLAGSTLSIDGTVSYGRPTR